MDMLSGARITAADLKDWRKLGQGLHARFVVGDFRAGVRFLAAISEAGAADGHLEVRMDTNHVDMKRSSWRWTPRTPPPWPRSGRHS